MACKGCEHRRKLIAGKADEAAIWLRRKGYYATSDNLIKLVTMSGWREVKPEQVAERAIQEGKAYES